MTGPEWKFYIDWDNDGDYDLAAEDVSDYVKEAEWRLGMKSPWQLLADEAEANLVMVNADQRFSPENTASPYYGSIVPRRGVLVQSVMNGSTVTHWTGYLQNIEPVPGVYGQLVTRLKANGGKQFLDGTEVFLALQEGVRAGTVISQLVQQVDSDLPLSVATGKTLFNYVGDTWSDGVDAYEGIAGLVQAEQGRFFQARSGAFTFWDRHEMLRRASNDGTVANWHHMTYRYGEDLVNRVGVTCVPRLISSGTADLLWSLSSDTTLEAGKSRTFRARFADDSGAEIAGKTLIQPGTANGYLAYSGGSVTVDTWTPAARSAEIELTNGGAADATITKLEVRGKKITTFQKQTIFAEGTASIAAYGIREKVIQAELLDSEREAEYVAKYLLDRLNGLAGVVPALTLMNKTEAIQVQMVTYTIGTRLRVQDEQTGHDGEHIIIGEQHRLRTAGKYHEVTWTLEPGDANQYWVLGVSKLGTETILAY